jgi:hypothetical protein
LTASESLATNTPTHRHDQSENNMPYTTDLDATPKLRKELRDLARALHTEVRALSASVGEVCKALHEQAREVRKEYRTERRRRVDRPLIEPVTVFHGNEGRSTRPGHECSEPLPVNSEASRVARE